MLSLVALYFIGKSFYTLADLHNKGKWGFTIAGIAVFYGAQFLLGIAIAIYNIDLIDSAGFLINIIGLIVGAIAAVLFYNYLKNKWENDTEHVGNPDILDDML